MALTLVGSSILGSEGDEKGIYNGVQLINIAFSTSFFVLGTKLPSTRGRTLVRSTLSNEFTERFHGLAWEVLSCKKYACKGSAQPTMSK